jgi:hypothetical protein
MFCEIRINGCMFLCGGFVLLINVSNFSVVSGEVLNTEKLTPISRTHNLYYTSVSITR